MLAAGHHSNFDPWAIGLPLWPRRFLRFMAKSELFWFPLGPLIRACGAFKVRRGKADTEAIQTGGRPRPHRERDRDVPRRDPPEEGTEEDPAAAVAHGRSANRARSRRAARARRHPRHGRPGTPRCLAVRYGAPVQLDDLAELEPAEAARVATERVMASIRELEASL